MIFSAMCTTRHPARVYKPRKWQTAAQSARVQKKWRKRWGTVDRPAMYKTPFGYFAHPALKPVIERAFAVEHTIRQYTDPEYGRQFGNILAADLP